MNAVLLFLVRVCFLGCVKKCHKWARVLFVFSLESVTVPLEAVPHGDAHLKAFIGKENAVKH